MSRSNNTELINPAVRFFDYAGGNGAVQYYDRETKENIEVKLPFKFLILDRVAQVGGGIDRNGSYEGFWSNAVRNTKTQPLTVRSKTGIECQGLYDAIKGYPGVKWITGLYIAFYDDDGALAIGYLKIKGSALNAWIEFTKSHKNIYEGAFGITGSTKAKKGTNTYYEPVFEHFPKVSDEADNVAKMLDVQLQEYLTAYFANGQSQEAAHEYSGGGNGGGYDEPPMAPTNYDAEPPEYLNDDEPPF